MVVLPERHSAQPGLGVRQEHVLNVLVCQHGHLHPLVGAGLHPAQEADTWHKLAPAVQIQPVCIVKTLLSLLAKRRGMVSSLELKISSECVNEF